jgi:hypothetical protein
MKNALSFVVVLLLFGLSSCIEIVDDMQMNANGSGTLNYNINLSASKVKINSIFALDSLDGKKVPSKDDVREKILQFKSIFEQQTGIEEVDLSMDFDNFMFKWQVSFANVTALQDAMKMTSQKMAGNKKDWFDDQTKWLFWGENKFTRSVPEIKNDKINQLKTDDRELLKKGTYISITRFETPVLKCDNPNAVISKNKLAVMVRADALSLSQNLNLLENTIYLSPSKP